MARYHYTYRITHVPTGRFYVGIRSCSCTPEQDPYMGSGVIIKRLLESHPASEFLKTIIEKFETRLEASDLESIIVTEELLLDPLCLNLKLGGDNSIIPNQFKAALARTGKKYKSGINPWDDPEYRERVIKSIKENRGNSPYPFMVSNGYWWVWKDACRIYDRWVNNGGTVNPTCMPKRGCGYKSIGLWYSKLLDTEYRNLKGDESVFRNMIAMFKDGWIPKEDKRFMTMINSSVTPGIVVIRGTSGTGKGTRVVQFLEWLRTKYEPELIEYEFDKKMIQVGFWFKEINLVFIGKYTVSNKSGLASWTSMDFIHSTLKSSEMANSLLKYLKIKFKDATIILEGEPMMQSHRWRPEFVHQDLGFNNMAFISFIYQAREDYDKRIIGRSGKAAKDTGWGRNEQYTKDHVKIMSEYASIGYELEPDSQNELFIAKAANENGVKAVGWNILKFFDAPLHFIGSFIIDFVGLRGLSKEEFQKYCDTTPMLRKIKGSNPLAHRVPEKPQKASKTKTKASAQPEATKAASRSLLDLMKKG